jgi:Sec-independent protein translocase protein TatA
VFGLSWVELFLVLFVGLLLFGGNLPKVAAEAASWIVRLKRSLNDLRRETGIDREIENARREIEATVEANVRAQEMQQKLTDTIARPFREALTPPPPGPIETFPSTPLAPLPPPPPPAPPPDRPRDEAAG